MADFLVATEEVIERSRNDPEFKQQLLTSTLERLLDELHRQRKAHASPDPARANMIREAAGLAAKLADIIRELDERRIARESATD